MTERQGKTVKDGRKEMKGVGDSDDTGQRERGQRQAEGRRLSRGKRGESGETANRPAGTRVSRGLPAVSLHSRSRVPPSPSPTMTVAGRTFPGCFLE